MFHIHKFPEKKCKLLVVLCGEYVSNQREERTDRLKYFFPELVSSGRLEVHKLINPRLDEFHEAYKSVCPDILYLQGEQLENEEELGSLVWGRHDVSDPEFLASIISPLPTAIYLEVQKSENIAQALYSKGVPYVIYWNSVFSSYASAHFRQALFSVIWSSLAHICDAFQLAFASFRLYCARGGYVSPISGQTISCNIGPILLGHSPKIDISPTPLEKRKEAEGIELHDTESNIKIHDKDDDLRFHVCGFPCHLDPLVLGPLEDGLNALLKTELRGSTLEAASFPDGEITAECHFTTCSHAYFSVLVSDTANTCFDHRRLEAKVKKELVEDRYQLVRPLAYYGEKEPDVSCNSLAIAAGAPVFEVCMKVPIWAAQVLKYLAHERSYRSLAILGIASIAGSPVAAFDEEDAVRVLFFCKDRPIQDPIIFRPPAWHAPLTSRRSIPSADNMDNRLRRRPNIALMRPVPHCKPLQKNPFLGDGIQVKGATEFKPSGKYDNLSGTFAYDGSRFDGVSLQVDSCSIPAPSRQMNFTYELDKHMCRRQPIELCSKEEFLEDVIHYLIHRGYRELVPQGGISEFPDVILNSRRLDLLNLYKEVVSRGGFRFNKGINWKGQVFSRMRNYTEPNKMTGIGSVLQRHYMTYLLEYELAHDDVTKEWCMLCNSGALGKWVNCNVCGEWAHYDCDQQRGLASFKAYAKADGLEYVCPHCSH